MNINFLYYTIANNSFLLPQSIPIHEYIITSFVIRTANHTFQCCCPLDIGGSKNEEMKVWLKVIVIEHFDNMHHSNVIDDFKRVLRR